MRNRFRLLAVVLFLAVPARSWAQGAEEAVLQTMARYDNRVGIAAYLRLQQPRFHSAAVKAGLADWLDGKIDYATFRSGLKDRTPFLRKFEKALGGRSFAVKTGPQVTDLYSSGAISDPAKMAEALSGGFYDAGNHPLARILGSKWWGKVGVQPAVGRLVWFNPYLSVPELGIAERAPLTPEQVKALESLLSVNTVTKGKAPMGTALYPADVGRAINPTPGVVTLVAEGGRIVDEMVSKGSGPTSAKISRDGRLDLSEALMDAEVSRNLQKLGVDTYVAVAVIDIGNGNAIYVRATDSVLRLQHIEKYSLVEARQLMDYVMSNEDLYSRAPPEAIRAWAAEHLPKSMGRNAGTLSGLGIKHGSLSSDNYGLSAELVDWGWAELGHRGHDTQKSKQLELVEKGIKHANLFLAQKDLTPLDRAGLEQVAVANGLTVDPNQTEADLRQALLKQAKNDGFLKGLANQVDLAQARATFEAEYDQAKSAALTKDIQLGARFLVSADESTLRYLAKGFSGSPGYSATKDQLLDFLKTKGVIVDDVDLRVIPGVTNDRVSVREKVRTEAAEAGKFAAAYLLKEAFKGRNAFADLQHPEFWKNLAVFSLAARAAEKLPLQGLERSIVPLAVGVAAVQFLSGNTSLEDLATTVGTFLVAGAVVNLLADGMIYPALFAAGPPGWIAAGMYTVGKLAVTLYVGEKLEEWLHRMMKRSAGPGGEGVQPKIEKLSPGNP